MSKFYVDSEGKYLGAFDGVEAPEGSIEVESAPSHASQLWDGSTWLALEVDTSEQERVWRDAELERADIELYKVQDSDPNAVGLVADWREYRKALRAWPQNESFPDSTQRPVAPDAVVEETVEE